MFFNNKKHNKTLGLMHNKKQSLVSTNRTAVGLSSQELEFYEENRRLKVQLSGITQQLTLTKRQMLRVYEENLELKQKYAVYEDQQFMNQCHGEIFRLRKLVQELMESKSVGPSQREEIKDRIIMKLEDELISTKIALREAKIKNF